MTDGLDQFSMRELFRMEVRMQAQSMVAGLLALEQNPEDAEQLQGCMRAAHSLKGAARLIDIGSGVIVAHAMEEWFVAAQEGRVCLSRAQIDMLLKGVDLLSAIGDSAETPEQDEELEDVAERYVAALNDLLTSTDDQPVAAPDIPALPVTRAPEPARETLAAERAMRVSADNLNRLLDLAAESLVESRRLAPLARSFQRLKHLQGQATRSIDALRDALSQSAMDPRVAAAVAASEQAMLACRQFLGERLAELETLDHDSSALARRLHDQALRVRMQPFADAMAAYPRIVRDVSHELGKQARLDVVGASTQVDRDILERLDAPLGHLLRNAVDHGIETPDARIAAMKPPEGVVRVDVHHSAGTLQIIVSDDGAGIDLDQIRARVIERKLADAQMASCLSEQELLEFLFLPGFTMKDEISQISGRGVGLDVVRDMVKQVGGTVTIESKRGEGTRFQLQLPLTLSVVRARLVDIAEECYAFSFGQILRATKVAKHDIRHIEGRQFFEFEGRNIGLVSARQILGSGAPMEVDDMLSVVVIGDAHAAYGVVVDRFRGARELVIQPLDPRLGKIRDISAGALMDDGTPLLVLDAEDMCRSMEKLALSDRLELVQQVATEQAGRSRRKCVLIVDDSFTVRELERKLLQHHGYDVEVAVDGMDGWNQFRGGNFDLVMTDVDMPRMDGIELVNMIRRDPRLGSTPVMIMSYKDREDDRRRGLDAGADYYLTKGAYQSDALIDAVVDLIGPAQA